MWEHDVCSDTRVDVQFFEMQRHDAIKALEIYKRAGQQVSLFCFVSGAANDVGILNSMSADLRCVWNDWIISNGRRTFC